MPTQPEFWDKVAEKYDKKTVKGPNYAARLERALAWAGAEASVLDAGCASGYITLDLAQRVQRVTGVDVSGKLIRLADERRVEQGVTNCSFRVGTVDDPSLEPGGFDAVTAYSLLHLVDDVPATLRRLHELLRPGGCVIAEVPCKEDVGLHWRVLIKLMTALGKAPVVKVYSQAEYEVMFRDAGFTVQEVKVYNPKSMSRNVYARRA